MKVFQHEEKAEITKQNKYIIETVQHEQSAI